MRAPSISVVIPTCERGPLLLDTLAQLAALALPPHEIIVVDQTAHPPAEVVAALRSLEHGSQVRWVRRAQRSIPAAMNHGVRIARGDVVLFLDDDVRIAKDLVAAHARAHASGGADIVAGQVIQPWQNALPAGEPGCLDADDPDAFRFNASTPQPVRRFMAGNVSMRRAALIALGGFDENFVGAAYRFEADLAERACRAGLAIRFEPSASVHHLKASHGGTRTFGHHLHTAAPWHSAGRYYYLLLYPGTPGVLRRTLAEAVRSFAAREHLRRPWRVPISAAAELVGLALAALARVRGPRCPLTTEGAR